MGYLAARLGADQPTQEDRDEIVEKATKAILSRCDPSAIFIFGSVLRSDFSRASDVDIAVIFSDQEELKRARSHLYRSPPLLSLPYDLVLFEGVEFERKSGQGGICQIIKETGKKTYE